ncbi:MAG TPA: thioester domain-containing protein [Pseudonocardiaceae bacterium]
MASRLNLVRVGAAVLAASAALLIGTPTATAATPHVKPKAPAATPVTAVTVDSKNNTDNGRVDLVGLPKAPTGLLALTPKGGGPDLLAYCVQINIFEGNQNTEMRQAPWADYPDPTSNFNSDSGKVNWILHNSFPTAPRDDLSKAAKTPTELSPIEAVEGTQAAIWHFSDKTELDPRSSRNDANVKALYQYLVGSAVELSPPTSNNPTLSLTTPARTTGDTGSEIGPFVVKTNLQLIQLSEQVVPSGVTLKVVDAAGHAVDPNKVVDGTRVFFKVPAGAAPGTGSFTVSGGLQVGQMFVGDDVTQAAAKPGGVRQNCQRASMQTLILAQSSTLSASGAAKWVVTPTGGTTTATSPATTTAGAAAPTTTTPAVANAASSGSLPFTGVNVLAPVVLAVVLIGAGGAFLLVQRRRKRA